MNDVTVAAIVAVAAVLYGLYLIGHGISREGRNAAGAFVVGSMCLLASCGLSVIVLLH